ncbi:uncharacterized protein L3040_008287 [Drepanopeziza brunnea f. sp. 'multigermtubi']|uniref:uncharacterized protein n=1 Tax=Drepanopeziza brunnea f. sp. 'multigermtubi' TaxID=698441 RepID=UPI00238DE303|nr:hypothetical protein L3040_008287 [Drepanopeziza brunnea f. sp. 'multigermtubi']
MSNDEERASLLARIAALEARMNQMESRTTIIITHAPHGAPSIVIHPANAASISISSSASTIRIPPELSSSEFGIPSPASAHQPERMNDSPAEGVPLIQQQLEKFIIVVAGLVAHMLAPHFNAAGTGINHQTRSQLAREENERDTMEEATQAENRRLTMHAGHTPNHSISKFHLSKGDADSGSATPTQEHHDENKRMLAPPAHGEEEQHSEDDHGDSELSHPLGLTNDAAADHGFLAELDEKLRLAKTIADAGSSNEPESSPSPLSSPWDIEDDGDEPHKLRLKPSCNFGKPLGEI